MKKILILTCVAALMMACTPKQTTRMITESDILQTIETLTQSAPDMDAEAIAKGVRQSAALWREEDGSKEDFFAFVEEHLATSPAEKERLYNALSHTLEVLNEGSNFLAVGLTSPTILAGPEPTEVDYILSGYSPLAHLTDDLFQNKVAFILMLNFPEYTLAEKEAHAATWSRQEWAYANLGDFITSRVPAAVSQQVAQAYSDAENYIADYNIYMGNLRTDDGEQIFPDDMVLLSHWNLRDELKANYADVPHAHEKQEMIYQVMLRIITQSIPFIVINDSSMHWMPYSNLVYMHDKEKAHDYMQESDRRYQHILNIFHAMLEEDKYYPGMPTGIQRNFEGAMQVSDDQIRDLFTQLLSSPEVAAVADVIRERLGRDLRPYDIWYDGFKARASMPEDLLTAEAKRRYPNADAFHADMPALLANLGFRPDMQHYLQDHIVVEGARGSGHAWECMGRTQDKARLRTRIADSGMDYKGFNIAVHEFGHNVEQVLSLYQMDYYPLRSIPNTGFTEAMAFLFQSRDLQLLGHGRYTVNREAVLDNFWAMYEIMGVSLVDMQMWQWLYAHPEATASQLRDATLAIARDVWNTYYEPILGEHDCVLLGIYSHMVNSPMYLPNYPYGHLVHFQLEEHLAQYTNPQAFADELIRIYTQGHLTPNAWMQGAVGADVSVVPVLKAVNRVLADSSDF